MATPPVYRFSHFQLRPGQRLLLAGETPLRLGGRAFDMLLALIERRQRTVSKHELMDLVWPRLVVEENNLQVQVAALRKLLGHPAIATVPGRGYRFTLPVQVEGTEPAPDADAAAQAPGPPGAEARTNLPRQGPQVLGRGEDLQALQRLLDEHALVTVAGAGGIGKTHLARGAARERIGALTDGVWWVELSAIADPALVPAAVGHAMGISFEGAGDATRAVLAELRGRSALVVLDSAEHLLDGVAAFVAAVREGAPRVKLLVTSQETLRAVGEHVFRLGPLSLPASDEPAATSASGAVTLFVERARAVDSRFALTGENRAAVIDICRQLDGIALAIELAAARLPLLGVEGLRARLHERFKVLTGGSRAGLRRHQTLRAALDWSHALLSPAEQAVFRRLGVFAGGFTLEAAQQVAEDEAIDGWDVLEHLGALVDKSLVQGEGDAVPRYRMLETTRLFALERLIESGEASLARQRHRDHFLSLAEDMEAHLVGSEPGRWIAALDPERDNLFLALAWSEGDDGAQLGLRLACALRSYWVSRGLLARGHEATMAALARPGAQVRNRWRCLALLAAAQQLSWTGRPADGLRLAEEALDIARAVGDDRPLCAALVTVGQVHRTLGHIDAMRQCAEEALAAGRRIGDSHELAKAIGLLAMVREQAREYEAAQQALEEERVLWQRLNLAFGQAVVLLNLAAIAIDRQCPRDARSALVEALGIVPRIDSRYVSQNLVDVACAVAAAVGEPALALTLDAASTRQREELRMPLGDPGPEHAERLEQARRALGPAAAEQAVSSGRALDHEQTLQAVRRWLAA